jgi:hypothetical protein
MDTVLPVAADNTMFYLYLVIGIIIIGLVGVFVYEAIVPNEHKAILEATPIFKTYESVTKLAPMGCPQTPAYRLCDYYIASSSYSVFPASDVYDYISDKIPTCFHQIEKQDQMGLDKLLSTK